MLHRTQLLIEAWQHEKLSAMAEREERSISSLVREILTEYLEAGNRGASRIAEIGGIAEGPSDLGRRHDDHLY